MTTINASSDLLDNSRTRIAVALLGVALLLILAINFNESKVAKEGALLTWVSVVLLLITASVSGLRCYSVKNREKIFWQIVSFGFVFLALDDALQIHENLDRGLHKLLNITETEFTDHIDDAIIAVYGAFLVCLLWYFKDLLKKHRAKIYPLSIAFIFFVLTVVLDFLHTDYAWDTSFFEEAAKVLAEYFFVLTAMKKP